ncbi:MAG: pyruvate, phosphate dikinase [Opitutales bacterium]|nr:pyruvate, phosphate dikinase [Opitutales bacterium]
MAKKKKHKAKAKKYVYDFGKKTDGSSDMKALLGGKGANLAEMARIGLPVPPGFTITTEVCTYFYDNKQKYPKVLEEQVRNSVALIEEQLGKKLGDLDKPLLLSVRSGARDSMPGMMDTILNLGLSDETVEALAETSGNARFAWDCYRRFIQMYGDVVMGVQKLPDEDHDPFESVIDDLKKELFPKAKGEIDDTRLTADHMKELVSRFKALVKKRAGHDFPTCPWEQLWGSVGAVFGSWMNDRATVYRQKYDIPAEWGTAVNVQAMVFGNTGVKSGSGVGFTRDPATGEKVLYGEYLIDAQGEDVVAGVRTPDPVAGLKQVLPKAFKDLVAIQKQLEKHFTEMQDFEFTIEDDKLYMLQTRNGKRTGVAAVRIANEMVKEKLIDWKTAITRVPADQLDQVLSPVFDTAAVKKAVKLCKGLPAGPGAASGRICLNADRAVDAAKNGPVLLTRVETSPEDLRGMIAAAGILTSRGGVSSHAALVARQMGKVCVCGAADLEVNYKARTVKVAGKTFKEGDYLSINGTTGEVFAGELKTAPSEIVKVLVEKKLDPKKSRDFNYFSQLMQWCEKVTKLSVRTNADSPSQVATAIAFGATGIGLCRTEHMFFEGNRIDAMRELIMFAGEYAEYKAEVAELVENNSQADLSDLNTKYKIPKAHFESALKKLLPHQRRDFLGMFKALDGRPATIRLLDPPLHEFLPHDAASQRDLAKKLGVSLASIKKRVADLHEFNPMLGHRGCRLGISYPEVTEMQARAIFEAAVQVKEKGIEVTPELMVPLVGFSNELELQVEVIHRVAKEVFAAKGSKVKYLVGTMIEIPRAALTADEIAKTAQFFSFGTNDLTQTALGMSRDDSGSFLPNYIELDILSQNPFASIDQSGVGQLMEIAVKKGKQGRRGIKLGICGEHGGEPDSVKFCHKIGLNYVSCSPYRVPTARLAAAQAAVERK